MTTKLKQVKSSLKKKDVLWEKNSHDKKGVAHPEKRGVASEVTTDPNGVIPVHLKNGGCSYQSCIDLPHL